MHTTVLIAGILYWFLYLLILVWWLLRTWPNPDPSLWSRLCGPAQGSLFKRRRVYRRLGGEDPEGIVRVLFNQAATDWGIREPIFRRVLACKTPWSKMWEDRIKEARYMFLRMVPSGSAWGWVQTEGRSKPRIILGMERILLWLPKWFQRGAAAHELVHCAQEIRWRCLSRCWPPPPPARAVHPAAKAGQGGASPSESTAGHKPVRFGEWFCMEWQALKLFPAVPVGFGTIIALLWSPLLLILLNV